MSAQECRLMIKIPTRSRPAQFFQVLDLYYAKLSHQVSCSFLITCDSDDKAMNNKEVIERLDSYSNLIYYFGESSSKIHAYNRDVEKHLNDFDVLVVTSDDMVPNIDGYDKIIAKTMLEQFPDFDGVLNFSDGFQTQSLNTYPIIGRKYYNRFGYVYYPGYKAGACDQEFTDVSKMLKREYYDSTVVFLHKHPYWFKEVPWDELYKKNDPPYWQNDIHLFNNRRTHKYYMNADFLIKNTLHTR